MDTELFMECEEEELEPWQQVDDSVEEDDVDYMEEYCEPVEESLSPLPASEIPSIPAPTAAPSCQMLPPPPPITSVTPPRVAQAPPLILTQTAGGTFLLPAAPGSGNAPPILLTTQGFPVMNRCAPLLLNLQHGQTVQPLTLISPSLGHLVRPSVGVSPVLPQGQVVPASSRSPAQPGSAFTAMQLPATLTIRTSTPGSVNIQMAPVSEAKSLTLAGSPALPSGSANGVTRISPFSSTSGPAPAVVMSPGVTSALSCDPPSVVMSVEDFYYGTSEGDLSLRMPQPLGLKPSTFLCQICSHLSHNNLRLMQHMLQHSELIGGEQDEEKRGCRSCYRQFSSPSQLQRHQDQVHGPVLSCCVCRICEWAFDSEPVFLNHMKSNHKPGEMPYVCQVCSYRSSFYSDVLQHFTSFHRDSHFLLCVFCLKVTRNAGGYQQHLLRHQVHQAFHCSRCRLQFVFLKDKMQHKLENHRSFRRPAQLEGLPSGSKVTIRTYGRVRPQTSAGDRLLLSPSSLFQPISIKTEQHRSPIHRSPSLSKLPWLAKKKAASYRANANRAFPEAREQLVCLECGTDASDFSAHYPSHVRCLLCPYSSCCSRAYAGHMIHHHVPQSKGRTVPLHKLPPPCVFRLQCSVCSFTPQNADHMAHHLLKNPEHYSATCCTRTFSEPDLRFQHSGEQPSPEEDPVHLGHLPGPSWRSADGWRRLMGGEPAESIMPFTQAGGPRHHLSKNSDALDFFALLFPTALLELITAETNAHAKTCRFLGAGCPDWVPVSIHEIKAFIGLVILIGTQNLQDLSHYWSWSNYDNSYTFYRAMSFKRFKQIAASIRMGSDITDECRGTSNSSDALHIFRPMLDLLGGAMWTAYQPNRSLTVDRALLPGLEEEGHLRRGPNNQPQVWLLCDSKSGFCHRLFIQVGETGGRDAGFTVVPELLRGLEGQHHHLYLASSLTSVPLLQKLLDQGVYASSSFPPPSPLLPSQLWEEGGLDRPGDFLQWQHGPLLATRWRDMKEMGCLSTNAAPGEADTVWRRSQTKVGQLDPIDRPMAFRLLQENMRGVDICKQLLACNPLGGVPQDRHWRSLFWFLINVSVVNAFIMLRESRKENPPTWVRDGLFSQLTFRKRLGNQLAKCAHKYFDSVEIASCRRRRSRVAEDLVKQRHRLAKISGASKRCRNCSFKNMRRESIYGCVACGVNLCKEPRCFWEFHGLPPGTTASIKVGFLKDRISGEVQVTEVRDHVDGAMAPVEDVDFSDEEGPRDLDDTDEDINEKYVKAENSPASDLPAHGPPAGGPSASKDGDETLSARQLRVILLALCEGLQQASRVFSTDRRLIRSWVWGARRRLEQTGREQAPDDGEQMVSWVLSMREQQLPINESNLFSTASMLQRRGAFSATFRISYRWAVHLLLRHRLGLQSEGRTATLARCVPPALQDSIASFRAFTQKVIRVKQLPLNAVAAMDELCLFVDLRLVQDRSRCSEALQLTGSLSLVTVYLVLLADGTMLPSLVLVNGQLPQRALPDFMLLEAGPESLLVEEALDLWTKRVWLPHVSGLAQPSRALLVLDCHREHLEESFVTSVSGAGTLPAGLPAGGSFCLQPLDVCLKPVLQRFLLARWAAFTAGNPKQLEGALPDQLQASVAQLLCDWLLEALALMNTLPQLWRKSFQLAGLLPGQQEEAERPEDIQAHLLKTLNLALLGPEPREASSPELEDREEEEEQDEDGEETTGSRKETQDEGQETKEGSSPSEAEKDGNDTRCGRGVEGKDERERSIKETEEGRKEEEEKETEEEGKETEEGRKEEEEEKETEEEGKETEEGRKEEEGKETEEEGKETEEGRKEEEEEKETEEEGKETEEGRKEEEGKETEEGRKEEEGKETEEEGKETEEGRKEEEGKETEEGRKEEEGKETEEGRKEEEEKETEEGRKEEEGKETEEEGKETEEGRKEEEGKEMENMRIEDHSKKEQKKREECGKIEKSEEGEEAEDRKEMKERRETRIVVGKDVGEEWKITVKSRTGREDRPDES